MPPSSCLELLFETLRRRLSVESFDVSAVVIDHVIPPDPIQLCLLTVTQLVVIGRRPPIRRDIGGTLTDANWSTPLASPCSKMMKPGYEWCSAPINLNKAASCRPVICIP